MPLYRFHIDVSLPPHAVAERLRMETLNPPGLLELIQLSWTSWVTHEVGALFFGKVESERFKFFCPKLRYRNPFTPHIWGRINKSKEGSHLDILMFMNPLVAAFTAFWLFMCGQILITGESTIRVYLFGTALFMTVFLSVVGIFFGGVFEAKKKLTYVLLREDTKVLVDTSIVADKVKCNKCGHMNAKNSVKCLYCGANILSVNQTDSPS